MKVEIKVPSAGESVTEATVASILTPNGCYVEKEEEILELETDKVNQTIYAPEAGILELKVSVDETVKIDQVLGTVDTDAKRPEEKKEVPSKLEKPEAKQKEQVSKSPQEGARRSPESYVASLESKPTQKTEKKEPVEKKSSPSKEDQPKQTRKRMSGLRRTIAKRLIEVKNTTAMLTTFNEVDMSSVMALRAREKDVFLKKHGVKLGFMSFFVKACVVALKELSDVNAFIEGEELVYNETYHIGISVSTDKGLMVPVVRNCDQLTFAEIEKEIQEFASQARTGTIQIENLQGGSFTITNGGVFGSMLSTPILNPPQSAILGMHNIVKRPVVVDDQIVIRPMMYLALSYDHRVIDGKEAVTFLVKVKEILEQPERLLFGGN